MTPEETSFLKQKVIFSTQIWWEKFNTKFGKNYGYPTVSFGLNGATAGTATYSKQHIQYNLEIAIRNEDDFLNTTIPHEIAHLFAYNMYHLINNYPLKPMIKPHGKEWKRVMSIMGIKPSRCHNYNVEEFVKRHERPFTYKCKCRTRNYTKLIHTRMQNGQKRHCLDCKGNITYSAEGEIAALEAALAKKKEFLKEMGLTNF